MQCPSVYTVEDDTAGMIHSAEGQANDARHVFTMMTLHATNERFDDLINQAMGTDSAPDSFP
jgi:hypothetical protein